MQKTPCRRPFTTLLMSRKFPSQAKPKNATDTVNKFIFPYRVLYITT